MQRLTQFTAFALVLVLFAVPGFADTLVLKSGERVSGYYEGGTARTVKFRPTDGVAKEYDILAVQQVQFGETVAAKPAAPAPVPAPATSSAEPKPSTGPRLVPGNERVTRPASANAARTGFTIPTGSKITIRMIDSINSETNKIGDTFVATLDEPLMEEGLEVVPSGADVRGRVANINEAGRVAGSAQLGLEL